MKEFLRDCLKNLYAHTGLEQVRWMQLDVQNGKRQFEECLNGLVVACQKFPYIPDADKKRIITEMIIADQDYTALTSRTIVKWLSMHKDKYFIDSQAEPEAKRVELTDEERANVDKLLNEFKGRLAPGFGEKPKYTNLADDMKKIKAEDEARVEAPKSAAVQYATARKHFNCDGYDVAAFDEETARKVYRAEFGKDPESVSEFSATKETN